MVRLQKVIQRLRVAAQQHGLDDSKQLLERVEVAEVFKLAEEVEYLFQVLRRFKGFDPFLIFIFQKHIYAFLYF